MSLTDWSFDPSIYAGVAFVCALYAIAHRRGWLSSSDDLRPWGLTPRSRVLMFAIGVLVCFVALESPIDYIGDNYLNAIHMVQHMLLMVVAPPLVLLGIAGARSPARGWMRGPWRIWTAITNPWTALCLFTATMWIWHYPPWYDAALYNDTLHAFEHLTLLAAGLVFFWSVVDPIRGEGIRPVPSWTKLVTMSLAGAPCTALAFIFIVAPQPFYSFYVAAPRLWGISALADQQLGGVAMLVLFHLTMFSAITPVFLRMFRGSPEDDERALEPLSALVRALAQPATPALPSPAREEAPGPAAPSRQPGAPLPTLSPQGAAPALSPAATD